MIEQLQESNVIFIQAIVEGIGRAAKCVAAEGLSATCIALIVRDVLLDISITLFSNALAFYTIVVNLAVAFKECLLRNFLLLPQ